MEDANINRINDIALDAARLRKEANELERIAHDKALEIYTHIEELAKRAGLQVVKDGVRGLNIHF